jgi:UDP-N-acetylmuramate--alanine ligase
MSPLQLNEEPRTIHLVGIGGAGVGAIARVLLEMGQRVTGSDRSPSAMTEELIAAGAQVVVGQAPELAAAATVVGRSTAVADDDPDVVAARAAGVPVLSRAEVLAAICERRPPIVITGTHGKTSTSAMLAAALEHSGAHPSFIVGSRVHQLGTGARWGTGNDFVVEGDESDGTTFALPRNLLVITNLEPDHLDFHGGFDRLRDAFDAAVANSVVPVLVCADDPETAAMAARHDGVLTYGTARQADFRAFNVSESADGSEWIVNDRRHDGAETATTVRLAVPGAHNVLNATAAFAAAVLSGHDRREIAAGLADYRGVARRYEERGVVGGVRFVDDYAHLPSEVAAAIAGMRSATVRLVAVFQPHRYSRTAALGRDFAHSFAAADAVVITDVYPAGEAPRAGVDGRLVADAVAAASPDTPVEYLATRQAVIERLGATLRSGDLCLTMGAGDLTNWIPEIQAELAARGARGE